MISFKFVRRFAQVHIYLVAGLVDGFQRRARQFQLPPRFEADIGAALGQANQRAGFFFEPDIIC